MARNRRPATSWVDNAYSFYATRRSRREEFPENNQGTPPGVKKPSYHSALPGDLQKLAAVFNERPASQEIT